MTLPVLKVMHAAQLYADVAAYCASLNSSIKVVFGWREPAKQTNQGTGRAGRIAFTPGDDSGKAGVYTAGGPRVVPINLTTGASSHSPIRTILTRVELVAVRSWGYDASDPNDESKQYTACLAVEDLAINAIKSATGKTPLTDPVWINGQPDRPKERIFGAERLFYVSLDVPIQRLDPVASPTPPATIADTGTFAGPDGDEPAYPHA